MRPLFIRQIFQKDRTRFTIEWTDGKIVDYRLSDVQRECPCARCRDELTGERRTYPEGVDEDVEAVRLESVGRYALRILFTSGCSYGIYTYAFLRREIATSSKG